MRKGAFVACLACGAFALSACDGGGGGGGPGDAGHDAAGAPDSGAAPLAADAGGNVFGVVGEPVALDGSGSTGAEGYLWSFGDGRGWDAPRSSATAEVTYDAPGRYQAVLTVVGGDGSRRTDAVVVTITLPPVHAPRQSSSVVTTGRRVAVVSPDSDELAIYAWDASDRFTLVAHVPTPPDPRTVTTWQGWLAVVCQDGAALFLVRPDGSASEVLDLPPASRPFGAVSDGTYLLVTLQATGEVASIGMDGPSEPVLRERMPAVEDGRHLALLPDGRVAVSRWRSPADRGEVAVVDPATGDRALWTLAFDPQNSSDTESGGVPTYLGPLVVSPTGEHAAIPALQANVDQGVWRSGDPLTFETTVRAVARFVDPETGVEDFAARKQFDNRGFAAAAAQSNRGDYLYFVMRGSRAVDRLDTFGNVQSGTLLDVGFAPQGVAVSSDDRFLFVDAYLSRNLVAYDLSTFSSGMAPIARLPTASAEPLPPEVLRGKQLFNDAFDPRLAKDGYIACAHCHLEGMEDHRVWDFTGRGEGLRNTISLLGRAGLGDGPLHWSANFDEIHDFEHDIRDAFEGTGLMADADFFSGTRSDPLGDPKAGLSADLDALAAYVSSLDEPLPSPFRAPDGSLTPEAEAGKAVFDALDCGSCHAGPRLTDSELVAPGTPLLHDVGTLRPSSGSRLGEPLEGIDTPTLHGLWHTAPYLHDGSAPTLRDVLEAGAPDDPHHVTDDLDPTEVDQLIAYLKSLDGRVD